MSKEYTVLVRRTQRQEKWFTVRADTPGEAKADALRLVYDTDWSEHRYESEYEAETVG